MGTEATVRPQKPWIISPVWDTLFVVGTPVLCIPLIYVIWRAVSLTDLSLLAVILATGHHLPTFLRTYGDRAIWQRYRVRLVAVPLVLIASQIFFAQQGWKGLVLWSLAWAPWHHGMQLYGFMRIYDAKQGQTARSVAWLDYLMCMSWFLTILLWSPHFMFDLGTEVYDNGLPLVPAAWLISFRWVATSATAAITVAYVFQAVWILGQGLPLSRVKLVLLLLSLFTYWFAFDIAPDPVVGLAASEIFHAVQYYAIVWIYNRRVVEKGDSGNGLLSFLFRPRMALVGLYVALVVGYGALNLGTTYLPGGAVGTFARDLFLISAILHIYFDCFIWKVRQPRTRKYLDVDEGRSQASPRELDTGVAPMPLPVELRQIAYVVAVVAVLGVVQGFGSSGRQAQAEEIAGRRKLHATLVDVARSGEALHALGRSYQDEGHLELARQHYEAALRVDPTLPAAHYDLALLQFDEARSPEQWREVVDHLGQSLTDRPTTVGANLSERGNPVQAETRANAHRLLGLSYRNLASPERALEHLRTAWELEPPLALLRQEIARDYAVALAESGRYREADRVLRSAIPLSPDGRLALTVNLARLLATCPDSRYRDPVAALRLAEYVCEATRYSDYDALEALADCYAALDRREDARQTAFRLIRLADANGEPDRVEQFRAFLDRIEADGPNDQTSSLP